MPETIERMWAAIILVFTIWVAAWQLMRRRDRRQDEASRLAARRRIRGRASKSEPEP